MIVATEEDNALEGKTMQQYEIEFADSLGDIHFVTVLAGSEAHAREIAEREGCKVLSVRLK